MQRMRRRLQRRQPLALLPVADRARQKPGLMMANIYRALLREIEADGKSVPVLLRQYLKLNARPIAFNVDPDFGNVVDALIYMDLRIMPTRLQDFYFTAEGGAKFRAFHGIEVPVK